MRDEHRSGWEPGPLEETTRLPPVSYLPEYEQTSLLYPDSVRVRSEYDGADENDEGFLGELLDNDRAVAPLTRARRFRKGIGKVFMITGGVIIVFVLLYAADLMISAGDVPRGVTVAGVEVGGLSRADAETKLRKELEPQLVQPVAIRAGDVDARLNPVDSGLALDWPGTLDQAGHQPLSPITRVLSFFTKRAVDPATKSNDKSLGQALSRLAESQLNHQPVEGSIGFMPVVGSDGGVTPYPIEPRQGQTITDLDRAADIVKAHWLKQPGDIALPVAITPVKATSAGVHKAMDTLVAPAVAQPITVHGDGKDVPLKPDAIASSFQFTARDGGDLEVRVNQLALEQTLAPQLADTEQQGKDAQILFAGDRPAVQPSVDGRKINWVDTFKPFAQIMARPSDRDLPVAYQPQPPALTTDAANALGINEVVGEFTTSGYGSDVATNVQNIAAKVNGAIVKPGATFSLDGFTGPRTGASGYTIAPVNEDGTGPLVLGGGVSQFTTTLYNAAYLAGLKDAGHTEHSYYLDRYPAGRDAKSLQDNGSGLDLQFTDDQPTGLAIQATASGGTVTVRIWGTKHYRVESSNSGRSDVSIPPVNPGPPGCQTSFGQAGFSTSDTRTLYDLASGAQVRSETRDVHYDPVPAVIC